MTARDTQASADCEPRVQGDGMIFSDDLGSEWMYTANIAFGARTRPKSRRGGCDTVDRLPGLIRLKVLHVHKAFLASHV